MVTGRTVAYFQKIRSELHLLLSDVSNPQLAQANSDLRQHLNEVRSIQMELMRMRSFSPRSLQMDAMAMAAGEVPSPTPTPHFQTTQVEVARSGGAHSGASSSTTYSGASSSVASSGSSVAYSEASSGVSPGSAPTDVSDLLALSLMRDKLCAAKAATEKEELR